LSRYSFIRYHWQDVKIRLGNASITLCSVAEPVISLSPSHSLNYLILTPTKRIIEKPKNTTQNHSPFQYNPLAVWHNFGEYEKPWAVTEWIACWG
jgi:hypothetical protein